MARPNTLPIAAAVLTLTGWVLLAGQSDAASKSAAVDATQIAAGEKVFSQCKSCHTLSSTAKDGVGPNLFGFYGSKAATHSVTFKYSSAMRTSGLTWNEASLNTFLAAPAKTVPGTKMTFGGVKDDAKRKALIAYLKKMSSE